VIVGVTNATLGVEVHVSEVSGVLQRGWGMLHLVQQSVQSGCSPGRAWVCAWSTSATSMLMSDRERGLVGSRIDHRDELRDRRAG